GEAPSVEAIEAAAVGPDPDDAGQVLVDRADDLVRQPFARPVRRDRPGLEAVEPAAGEPEATVPIDQQVDDVIVREAVPPREGGEAALRVPVQAAAVRGNPDVALVVFIDAGDQ